MPIQRNNRGQELFPRVVKRSEDKPGSMAWA
jgi:hypothetical protein